MCASFPFGLVGVMWEFDCKILDLYLSICLYLEPIGFLCPILRHSFFIKPFIHFLPNTTSSSLEAQIKCDKLQSAVCLSKES